MFMKLLTFREHVFFGISNSVAMIALGVLLEAVVEACFTAFSCGLEQILILSDSRGLLRTLQNRRTSSWQTCGSQFLCSSWLML